MELQNNLNLIFCEVLDDDDDIRIAPGIIANDVDGWDSLSHVNMIVASESKYKIGFSHKELLTFRNVGDLLNGIRSKIAA